jgi:hypothetical protein
MGTPLDTVLGHLDSTAAAARERLFELLRIPSISTDPAFDEGCRRAAEYCSGQLRAIGFEARVAPTAGIRTPPPAIYCFTAIMTSSRSIRSTCGRRRPSSRASPKIR